MCASLMGTGMVHAAAPAAASEVQQLIERGQLGVAAERVQAALRQDASDIQLRFLQAVIAAEQKKYDQAIQLFTALTRDHPQLPEPYNNLAVLYAAKGESRKAAQVLEQAIQTNPSYATAHQNLGDIYARIASEAYAKALQLDATPSKADQPKLAMITRIHTSTPGAAPLPAPTTVAAAPVAPAAAKPPAAPQPQPAATPAAKPPVEAAPAPQKPPVPAPAAQPATTPPSAAAEAPSAAEARQQATKAVEKAVLAWAAAWEQQNMPAYYAAYSPRFDPQGMSLDAWKTERKNRIVGKPAITVKVHDLKVSVDGEQATASFRQQYASGGYKATTRKTLRLRHEGGKWRITREETGR